jgi:hypothetical protein
MSINWLKFSLCFTINGQSFTDAEKPKGGCSSCWRSPTWCVALLLHTSISQKTWYLQHIQPISSAYLVQRLLNSNVLEQIYLIAKELFHQSSISWLTIVTRPSPFNLEQSVIRSLIRHNMWLGYCRSASDYFSPCLVYCIPSYPSLDM